MSIGQDSDAALIGEIARGERMAIATLYDRYAPVLYPIALRILRNPEDAEDVLHDTMVLVWQRASSYTPERGSVAAWLVTLVRNGSIDRLRRGRTRETLGPRVAEDIQAHPPTPSPEAQVGTARLRHAVRQAIVALPANQQALLIASFFEGLTYQEIAQREGVPLGTIKSRAGRAIASLRASLAEEGQDLGLLVTGAGDAGEGLSS